MPLPTPTAEQRQNYFWLVLCIGIALIFYRSWLIGHWKIDLYSDEAYYWTWAQQLDWGYYSKPPVIAALIAASCALLGKNIIAVKFTALLLYPLTALIIYGFTARYYGNRSALMAALLFLSSPLAGWLGLFVSTDAPLLLCWTLASIFLYRALDEGRWQDWLLLGLCTGLGLLSKYTMLAFIAGAFLAALVHPHGRQQLFTSKPWLAILLAFLIFSPNLLWNWHYGFPSFHHTTEITSSHTDHSAIFGVAEFIISQLLVFGLPAALILLTLIWQNRRQWRSTELSTVLALSVLPLLLIATGQSVIATSNANWAAPVIIPASIITAIFLNARIKTGKRLFIFCLCFNVFILASAYHWSDIVRASDNSMSRKLDIYKRARGWQAFAEASKPFIDAHPQALIISPDRDILAYLSYYLDLKRIAGWSVDGKIASQYQLRQPLSANNNQELLVFVRSDAEPLVTTKFSQEQKLGELSIPIHPDYSRRFTVFLVPANS